MSLTTDVSPLSRSLWRANIRLATALVDFTSQHWFLLGTGYDLISHETKSITRHETALLNLAQAEFHMCQNLQSFICARI